MDQTKKSRIWKLELSYDGTEFHGWQIQPELPTIQGELRAAIERVTGELILPQGSGRTDRGVHALGQVASFPLHARIPEANLIRALNRTLPPSIRVLGAEIAPDDFHARHSAKTKTYEYRIFRGEICPPWIAPYCHALPRPLDIDAMQEAAASIAGEHDFTSFAARDADMTQRTEGELADSEPRRNVRLLYVSRWYQSRWTYPETLTDHTPDAAAREDAPDPCKFYDYSNVTSLTYVVKGNGFLHHMVRNLVGTLLEVGGGRLHPSAIEHILSARDRATAGPTAPAHGLFLREVTY